MGNTEKQPSLDYKLKGDELILKNLTSIPFEVSKINFKSLNLGGNEICFIDDSLSNKKIEEVNLNSNKLNKLPENLISIQSITKLNLSSNKLTKEITSDIFKLKNLKELNLSFNNELKEFNFVEKDFKVVKLNLSSCNLKKISS